MTDLDLFLQAPPGATSAELAAWLDQACVGDTALRKRVEALFAAESAAGAVFMEAAPVGNQALEEPQSGVIGNYQLLQKIGEGGFGTVYMADQLAPVKRKVALKIIKLGMDTRQVVARFEAERQALAMMDHPNIAKVFDAGATEQGRPFFVMELVRGTPITQYCDDNNLATAERLALFTDVCHAVQHAHQKGIIHRDLKSSNVMVTMHDDRPVPKVIDFGVAKATEMELTEKTLFTQFDQFIGTPAYMSPEQAQRGGLDIDTRSDVYSLGVLLYELLAGRPPFDGRKLMSEGYEEIRRIIREDDPPKPSTRLSTLADAELTVLAKHRKLLPDKLRGLLRGDLDWIIMKAMEKDRTRRYDTANGLAMDIARHLADEPVLAGPPGFAYRTGKLLRRHRGPVAAAATIAALLVGGATVSTWQAVKATRARNDLGKQLSLTQIAEAAATKAKVAATQAQVAATDARAIAEQRERSLAFDLVDREPDQGIAQLARFIRRDPLDRVAGERLMHAMQQREVAVPLHPSQAEGHFASYSPDGDRFVVGHHQRGTAQVFNSATGEPVKGIPPFKRENMRIAGLAFSPDGRKVVIHGGTEILKPGFAEVWDLEKPDNAVTLEPETDSKTLCVFSKFSPDGQQILSCYDVTRKGDGYANVSDARTGKKKWTFREPLAMASGDWNKEGNRVVTGGDSGIAVVWDTTSGKEICRMRHTHDLRSVRFSPDGKRVLTASLDHTAQLWDAATGIRMGEAMRHSDKVERAEFSPDGTLILTASADRTARLWDAGTGRPVSDPLQHKDGLTVARFSRDGRRAVTGDFSGVARVWDTGTGRSIGPAMITKAMIVTAEFSPDGSKVLTAWNGGADQWAVRPEQPDGLVFQMVDNKRWASGGNVVRFARFSPDGKSLLSSSAEEYLRVWDTATGRQKFALEHGGLEKHARFSGDGKRILTVTAELGFKLWDAGTGKSLVLPGGFGIPKEFPGHITVADAEFSRDPEGRYVAVALAKPDDAQVRIWDTRTNKVSEPLKHHGGVAKVAFSPDNRRLVSTAANGQIFIWDCEKIWDKENDLVTPLKLPCGPGPGRGALFSPDGLTVLTGVGEKAARLWDAFTGKEIDNPEVGEPKAGAFPHRESVESGNFNRDGSRFVTGSADGTAVVWDVKTQKSIGEPMKHAAAVLRVRFSMDGLRVVSACADGTGRVWDAATGFPLSGPLRHEDMVRFAEFSPDEQGVKVVTAGDDTTARLWDVPPAPPGPVPDWVPAWAEAVVGLKVDAARGLIRLEDEERAAGLKINDKPDDGFYKRIAQWYHKAPSERTITPFSEVTLDQYIANLVELGKVESLEQATLLAPDPVPLYPKLAALLLDPGSAGSVEMNYYRFSRLDRAADLHRARHYAAQAAAAAEKEGDQTTLQKAQELLTKIRRARARFEGEASLANIVARAEEAARRGDRARAISLHQQVEVGRLLLRVESGDLSIPEMYRDSPKLAELVRQETPGLYATLVARGSSWRYIDAGENAGPGWSGPDFDDQAWAKGPAPLGYDTKPVEEQRGPALKTTLESRPTPVHFRRWFEWPEPPKDKSVQVALRLLCDDGAVVYLNGVEQSRSNMPGGPVTRETQALNPVNVTAVETDWRELVMDRGALRPGANVLAITVYQKHGANPSSDLVFDAELLLQPPPSLASLTPAALAGMLAELQLELPVDLVDPARNRWAFAVSENAATIDSAALEDLECRADVQAGLGRWDAALAALDAGISRMAGSFKPADIGQHRLWLRRKIAILMVAGRLQETEALKKQVTAVPPRDPALSPRLIDLTSHYTNSFVAGAAPPAPLSLNEVFERLPETFTPTDGIAFDLRGKVQLNSGPITRGNEKPEERLDYRAITGTPLAMEAAIPVEQKAQAVHFLHAATYGYAPAGTLVAEYVLHFADGSQETAPVIIGTDVADWLVASATRQIPAGLKGIAWQQPFFRPNGPDQMALTRQSWKNPKPDVAIERIEFISKGEEAAPFLVGITLE
ncbi:MAG: protein kinase domain-containing protein [Verrucomicrobiales bacterium]